MIPPEKSAAVTRGLSEAFGVTEFEDIQVIKSLASSSVYRIVVQGSPFLLKISLRTNDPARHYGCMRAAADAGLAPRVWYASIGDRVSIEDFVENVPLPRADALALIPAALRRLHALPPFPGVPDAINTSCMYLINKGPALDAFLQRFQAANILPKPEADELFARYAQVAAAYSRNESDMVSCHNDLFKPENLLFDGKRVWLVDWEAAFLNDRYADLAVVSNWLVSNDAEERTFLEGYFGAPPSDYQLARFSQMKQIAHIFYAMGFLFLGSMGGPIDWSEPVPGFEDFHRRMWAGEVSLTESWMKVLYGRVHLERLLQYESGRVR